MREIRPSGSEGGVRVHPRIPTPIGRLGSPRYVAQVSRPAVPQVSNLRVARGVTGRVAESGGMSRP